MGNFIPIFLISSFLLIPVESHTQSLGYPSESRVSAVVQKMESHYQTVVDYTCEVEQIFYQDGTENQRYRFKFYFKREKKIRVDFSYPHSGLTILYKENDKEATVIPSRSLPIVRFRISVDNPLLRTLAGQKINQTDIGYFINFIFNNLDKVSQKGNIFFEDERRIEFVFWALDYIEEKSIEKYRVSVPKKEWLPTRIERYGSEDKLLEVTEIKDYHTNTHLEDKLFQP